MAAVHRIREQSVSGVGSHTEDRFGGQSMDRVEGEGVFTLGENVKPRFGDGFGQCWKIL